MQRDVEQNWDYRALHTSGQKVVKPDDMSDIDRLKQHYLDSIDEVDEFIEDHKVQEFDHIDEANLCLQEVNIIVEKYKSCQSEFLKRLHCVARLNGVVKANWSIVVDI